MIRSYKGITPAVPESCYVDDSAQIIGDVVLAEHASVWMNAVLRGDVHSIRIGAHSNIQDCSVLHGMKEQYGVFVGEYVTVGHSVTLHGCVVEDRCLIGMGCIILNGARIGAGSIIAAGTLIRRRRSWNRDRSGWALPASSAATWTRRIRRASCATRIIIWDTKSRIWPRGSSKKQSHAERSVRFPAGERRTQSKDRYRLEWRRTWQGVL